VTDTDPTVVVPAGRPFLEAAAWVGASCRAELVLHDRLTRALAAGAGAERSAILWTVRAHRAEVAEAWHRRLPELRELPRDGFVAGDGSDGDRSEGTGGLVVADDPGWVADALDGLAERYRAHLAVAVGPADGPVADTLALAIHRAEADRAALVAG